VDSHVDELEKQVANLTVQVQSLQGKQASEASIAPPSNTPPLPSGSLNLIRAPVCIHPSLQATRTWTVADIGKWLVSTEMGKYCQVFAVAPINGEMLKLLTSECLLAYGISDEVHRLYILDEIATLFAPQGSSLVHSHPPQSRISHPLLSHRLHHCPSRYEAHFRLYFSLDRSSVPTQTMPTTRTI
jgi:hypothetical protein